MTLCGESLSTLGTPNVGVVCLNELFLTSSTYIRLKPFCWVLASPHLTSTHEHTLVTYLGSVTALPDSIPTLTSVKAHLHQSACMATLNAQDLQASEIHFILAFLGPSDDSVTSALLWFNQQPRDQVSPALRPRLAFSTTSVIDYAGLEAPVPIFYSCS